MSDLPADKIVLFDGVCNFCNSSVQLILKHDRTQSLRFAALQSATGMRLLKEYAVAPDVDSVIFIENGRAYTKSSAALRIVRYFGGGWSLFRLFVVVPVPLRNFIYDIIARNRYKWFGKRDTCMIPSPEIRARFIDF